MQFARLGVIKFLWLASAVLANISEEACVETVSGIASDSDGNSMINAIQLQVCCNVTHLAAKFVDYDDEKAVFFTQITASFQCSNTSGQVEQGILVDDEDGVLESTEYFHPLETSTTQCEVVLDYIDENEISRNIISEACIIQRNDQTTEAPTQTPISTDPDTTIPSDSFNYTDSGHSSNDTELSTDTTIPSDSFNYTDSGHSSNDTELSTDTITSSNSISSGHSSNNTELSTTPDEITSPTKHSPELTNKEMVQLVAATLGALFCSCSIVAAGVFILWKWHKNVKQKLCKEIQLNYYTAFAEELQKEFDFNEKLPVSVSLESVNTIILPMRDHLCIKKCNTTRRFIGDDNLYSIDASSRYISICNDCQHSCKLQQQASTDSV